MKHIADGYCVTTSDLFFNFNHRKRLKSNSRTWIKYKIGGYYREVCSKVFIEFMKLVIDDIIDNNESVNLITKNKYTLCLQMEKLKDENFKWGRKKNRWKGLDLVASNFSVCGIFLRLLGQGNIAYEVRLDKKRENKIIENINSGKIYY